MHTNFSKSTFWPILLGSAGGNWQIVLNLFHWNNYIIALLTYFSSRSHFFLFVLFYCQFSFPILFLQAGRFVHVSQIIIKSEWIEIKKITILNVFKERRNYNYRMICGRLRKADRYNLELCTFKCIFKWWFKKSHLKFHWLVTFHIYLISFNSYNLFATKRREPSVHQFPKT